MLRYLSKHKKEGGVQMFNERLFRAKVVLNGLTLMELALKLGINESTLHGKLKREGAFTRSEINRISNILGLSKDDVFEIFFAPEHE